MARRAGTSLAAMLLAASLGACGEAPLAPELKPQFSPGDNGNGAIVEVGEYRAPFGLVYRDAEQGLLLYFRWDDGFCGAGAPTPTEFVLSTYKDVVRLDESWRTVDKTDGMWFYVYAWNGTPPFPGCNFLRNNPPLATGRGARLLLDNDYYPFAPYGPGPGANTYLVKLRGTLTTPTGEQVQLLAQQHMTVAADGETIRHRETDIRLSPDPRR